MSYEIYYDRAFIRVNDLYVPLVNQGSNNCFEVNPFGRDVPEKNWQVLNWRDRSRLLYTETEVREIAGDCRQICQDSGTCFKSRNRPFEPGEFERWILCGLKSAFTVEEYVAAGNRLEINDYSAKEIKDWKFYPFSTTGEFMALIDTLKGRPLLNIHFENNREVRRPIRRPDYCDGQEYYVLCSNAKGSTDLFFRKLARRGYYLTHDLRDADVRTFETQRAAQKYLDKYADRLNGGFEVKRVQNMKLAG